MNDWISAQQAADLLGVSRSTVYRSLDNADERQRMWGDEGVGWRHKPLTVRRIYQVSRKRTEEIASTGGART